MYQPYTVTIPAARNGQKICYDTPPFTKPSRRFEWTEVERVPLYRDEEKISVVTITMRITCVDIRVERIVIHEGATDFNYRDVKLTSRGWSV